MTPPGTEEWVIAIDGPAGAGKSSVARRVAAALGYFHLDTGAMYRAVTLACLRAGLSPQDLDERRVAPILGEADVRVTPDGRVFLGAEDVSVGIRSAAVTALVSQVSALPIVRHSLVEMQRRIARELVAQGESGARPRGVVVDGRDIGSHVFPRARHRIYLDASLEERARRRKLQDRGHGSVADWKAQLQQRDRQDSGRAVAPLRVPEGALVIDTTHRSETEVVGLILEAVQR